MIKRYCDCCNVEITKNNEVDDDHHRLRAEIKTEDKTKILLSVEVIMGRDNTWNGGDFCKYCVIDAINEADDRTKSIAT